MEQEKPEIKLSYEELHRKYHAGELTVKQIQEKYRMDSTRHIHKQKANCEQCDL